MASITIRDVPAAVCRARRVRAMSNNRSTEAEIRDILQQAIDPKGRRKLGWLLASIAREAGGLSEAEANRLDRLRDRTPAEAMRFD